MPSKLLYGGNWLADWDGIRYIYGRFNQLWKSVQAAIRTIRRFDGIFWTLCASFEFHFGYHPNFHLPSDWYRKWQRRNATSRLSF